jgi:hypothetical protein
MLQKTLKKNYKKVDFLENHSFLHSFENLCFIVEYTLEKDIISINDIINGE